MDERVRIGGRGWRRRRSARHSDTAARPAADMVSSTEKRIGRHRPHPMSNSVPSATPATAATRNNRARRAAKTDAADARTGPCRCRSVNSRNGLEDHVPSCLDTREGRRQGRPRRRRTDNSRNKTRSARTMSGGTPDTRLSFASEVFFASRRDVGRNRTRRRWRLKIKYQKKTRAGADRR